MYIENKFITILKKKFTLLPIYYMPNAYSVIIEFSS